MNKSSNTFTYTFAVIMVLIVATILSSTAIALKPEQTKNKEQEKMQDILSTIGLIQDRAESEKLFGQYVTKQMVLDYQGNEVEGDAFQIDLAKEIKKPTEEQSFPLFIAEKEGRSYYIVPLRGAGLWDAIWGYICVEEDLSTVYGATFDHKSETPGLGAEINKMQFKKQFIGKKIMNEEGSFKSIKVVKGGVSVLPETERIYGVDAISGGTITSDGVTNMLKERLENYLPYFEKIKS